MSIILSWDVKPQYKSWSAELLNAVTTRLESLEQGNPKQFIVGYSGLSADNKIKFWSEIIIAMIKFESDFNPHSIYHEPPPLGVDSIGLLQLSYEDRNLYHLEPLDKNNKSLEDPLVNIRCGLTIFAHWMEKDRVVASGSGGSSRGSARYWSVMREGANHHVAQIRSHAKNAVGL